MIAAEHAFLDELLAAGEITAEEAEQWRQEAAPEITELVNTAFPDEYAEDDLEEDIEYALFFLAAETIGMSADALWHALEQGQTVAQVAQENGVAPQTVIDALNAAVQEFLNELLAEGEITAEEAEQWRQEAAQEIADFVNSGW